MANKPGPWRTVPLPAGWALKRGRVLRRDRGVCHWCGKGGATECDHVIPASRGGTDDDDNLAPIHGKRDVEEGRSPVNCHATKTAKEARGEPRARRREKHPGDLDG